MIQGRKMHYDPKQCFIAWVEAGSLKKAIKLLQKDGVVSPNGGKPSLPGIQRSAKRYVTLFPEEARQILIDSGYLYLIIDAEWVAYAIRAAAHCFGRGSIRFKNWLVFNEYWEHAVNMGFAQRGFIEKEGIYK